jgi:hypothetical protein
MSDLPLHKRTHFRKMREVMIEIGKYEGFNTYDYDFFSMTVYETVGEGLKGKNVSYNIKGGFSCWVKDNRYDIFEVPSKSNQKGSPYGDFLFLAYNKSFDYYLFGYMSVTLNRSETIRTRYLSEAVHFKNHGKFNITFETYDNNVHKVEYGSLFDPGVQSDEHNFDFDSYNSRRKAYKTDRYKILRSIDPSFKGTGNPNKVVDTKKVPIYKDRKNGSSSRPKSASNKPYKANTGKPKKSNYSKNSKRH